MKPNVGQVVGDAMVHTFILFPSAQFGLVRFDNTQLPVQCNILQIIWDFVTSISKSIMTRSLINIITAYQLKNDECNKSFKLWVGLMSYNSFIYRNFNL